jgi:hypothetical protein
MLQFGASLTDDASSVNYDRNVFIIQTTGVIENGRVGIVEVFSALTLNWPWQIMVICAASS